MPGTNHKGTISKLLENRNKAVVKFDDGSNDLTTLELVVPWFLKQEAGEMQIGDKVCFVQFDDYDGVILSRMDSKGGKKFDWEQTNTVDFVSDTISGKNHTHSGVMTGLGDTQKPN